MDWTLALIFCNRSTQLMLPTRAHIQTKQLGTWQQFELLPLWNVPPDQFKDIFLHPLTKLLERDNYRFGQLEFKPGKSVCISKSWCEELQVLPPCKTYSNMISTGSRKSFVSLSGNAADPPEGRIRSSVKEKVRARATLENTRKELDDRDSSIAMAKKARSKMADSLGYPDQVYGEFPMTEDSRSPPVNNRWKGSPKTTGRRDRDVRGV